MPDDADRAPGDLESVNIFISHKSEDAVAASEIKTTLTPFLRNGSKIFCSSVDIDPGDDWRGWISKSLADAKILLLLFTDPRASWDWCLFEAGLFLDRESFTTPEERHELRRVVCLHREEISRPEPLNHLETVLATPEGVAEFLTKLFGSADYAGLERPLNPDFVKNTDLLNQQAHKITGLLAAPEEHWSPLYGLIMSFTPENLETLKTDRKIPDTIPVEVDDRTLDNLFGLGHGQYQWTQLWSAVEHRSDVSRVASELVEAMLSASERRIHFKLAATLRAAQGGAIFRPVLHRVDFREGRACRFHVHFTEEVKPASIAGRGLLGRIFERLQVGHRFRSEVLDPYLGRIDALIRERGEDAVFRGLKDAILLIESELREQNMLSAAALHAPFEDDSQKRRLDDLLQDWEDSIRNQLITALEEKDAQAIEGLLSALERASREFVAICAQRYAELARQELAELQ